MADCLTEHFKNASEHVLQVWGSYTFWNPRRNAGSSITHPPHPTFTVCEEYLFVGYMSTPWISPRVGLEILAIVVVCQQGCGFALTENIESASGLD